LNSIECLEGLKRCLLNQIRSKVPGIYSILELTCLKNYGKGLLDLLFESPSRLYLTLMKYYGSADSANYAVTIILVNPIAECVGVKVLREELLKYLVNLDDRGFLSVLSRHLGR